MKTLVFLLLLLVVSGCSNKAKTKAKLDFVSSFSNVLGPLSAGGALVHGVNLETGETLTIFPSENGEEVSMSSNLWSFQALVWNGPNKMEGTLRCGKTTADLDGVDVTITLNVDQSGCNDISLLDTAATTAGQPLPTRFANCDDLGPISSAADNCTSNLGTFNSYQISLLPTGVGEGLYSPLTSACIDESGLLNGLTISTLRIPFATFIQNLSNLEVIAYANAGCTGAPTLFRSFQGLQNLSPNAKSFFDGTYTTIYLSRNATGTTIGSLPYLAPLTRAEFISANYKTTIKIQAKIKNKSVGASSNYKLRLSGETYPEKIQQKISTNYKLILGN